MVQDVSPCFFLCSCPDVCPFLCWSVLSCRVTCLSLDRLPSCFLWRLGRSHAICAHLSRAVWLESQFVCSCQQLRLLQLLLLVQSQVCSCLLLVCRQFDPTVQDSDRRRCCRWDRNRQSRRGPRSSPFLQDEIRRRIRRYRTIRMSMVPVSPRSLLPIVFFSCPVYTTCKMAALNLL